MKPFFITLIISLLSNISTALPLISTYAIQGTNSVYGAYTGILNVDGQKVSRVVTYSDAKFRGLKIQEVWIGNLQNNQLLFNISTADFIRSVPQLTRIANFHSPEILVTAQFEDSKKAFTYKIENQSYSETLQEPLPNLEPTWPWQNQRQKIKIEEPNHALIYDVGFKLAIEQVFEWFRSHPDLNKYPKRTSFYKNEHFSIYDSTDFDFYRQQPSFVRVQNKTLDEISLMESYLRWSAYAFSDEQKAKEFELETESYMLDDNGLLRNTTLDDSGKIVSQDGDGDGALWSGMYNATLAMKYQVTGDPDALAKFKRGLSGMFLLMDITGDNKRFARNVRVKSPQFAPDQNWHTGTGNYSNLEWLSEGNNDMLKGIILSFAWAYHILPSSDPMWSELNRHAYRLKDLQVAQRLNNKATALGLATLATHRADYREDYIRLSQQIDGASGFLGIDQGFYLKGIADWSGINLNMVSTISDILIADAIQKQFPTGKLKRWEKLLGKKTEAYVLNTSRESLMNQWATYANAKRDFFSLAAYAFAYRFGTRGFDYDSNLSKEEAERTWKMRKLWNRSMQNIVWAFREMPIQRSGLDIKIDHSLNPDFSISSSPRLPWKSIKDRQPIEYHIQGTEIYPIFEISGCNSNFVWKDGAFNYRGNCHRNLKMASVDYLFIYWMKLWSGWTP